MKPLFAKDVCFTITAEYDSIPVRGNAIASGDNTFDKQVEDEILERLDKGDVWAWASVKVEGSWKGLKAVEYLGACSYTDEKDFKSGGYYDDMCAEILVNLNKQLEEILERG